MKYVNICTAVYDYKAQNDEEISFNADDVLYILENSDPDWFKAQLKVQSDQDGPVGLVPSNYIQKAASIGSVRALYDYQSRSKEEISFKEDNTFLLYEKDDPDWYVVEATNGEMGLVPSNYVEIVSPENTTSTQPIPQQHTWATALYSFKPEGPEETHLDEKEKVIVLEMDNQDWWKIQHKDGSSGIVPASYIQLEDSNQNNKKEQDNLKRQEDLRRQEELKRQEEERKIREEEQKRQEEQRQKELAEYNRIKQQEEKEKERQAEAERRRRLQEEAKQRELDAKKQQLAPPVVPSPQLGSPRRSQIPAPPPPTHTPDPNKPSPSKIRTWTDNTGAFKVEAQFLACSNGKIRLHKLNGVKIDVPVGKMCMEDIRYVEKETGMKLVEDKNDNVPLAQLQKGKFNWLDYFKRMNMSQKASVEYAGTFEANQLTEADIEKLTYRQMKMLGMSEKHIRRFQKYIETNHAEPPSDDESTSKPKAKVKKTVTFGAVSYIPYHDDDNDTDDVNWQINQDEQYARQLQQQEQNHVGLQRRGTGRPTPAHSAPQNVNFSVLTPQQFQPSPAPQHTPTPPITQAPAQPPMQPAAANNSFSAANNQVKAGFEDDAWTPRNGSPSIQQSRSISTHPPPAPVRQRPTPQISQQSMVDPELLAKWGGSPALAAANHRPVPAPPAASQFSQVQQQQQVQLTPQQFTPQQPQNNFPLQQQNSFTGSLQQQNSFTGSLQQQNSFTGSLHASNTPIFQQRSPMMNHNNLSYQSSPSLVNNYSTPPTGQVPLQSVLPAPLIPQTTANTFTPPISSQFNQMVQPQMTGRNWSTATPDNPFGHVQQNTNFQQPQNTGYVPIDPNDKYAVFKNLNPSTPSVFNTGH